MVDAFGIVILSEELYAEGEGDLAGLNLTDGHGALGVTSNL